METKTYIQLPNLDTASPEEIARCYKAIQAKRAKEAMHNKAQRGDLPGCAPVGYRNTYEFGEATLMVDEKLAPLVKEAFDLAAEGTLSLRKILEVLTVKGLVSRNGKIMGTSALHALLTNPFYMGKLRYNGELLGGKHQSLVSSEVFERVQENLATRRRR